MGFVQAVQSCFSKYVTLSGRAPRSEYWFFFLFVILVEIVTSVLDSMLGLNFKMTAMNGEQVSSFYGPITSIAVLLMFLPNISVFVRRLHDGNRSGWWFWFLLVPLVGVVMILIWFSTRGTVGENRFGPDPIAGAA